LSVFEDMGEWGYCKRCNFLLLLTPGGFLPEHRSNIGGLCLRGTFGDAEEGEPDPPYPMPPTIDTHNEITCRQCQDIRHAQRTSAVKQRTKKDKDAA
jgi:hypothetical protein